MSIEPRVIKNFLSLLALINHWNEANNIRIMNYIYSGLT